MCLWCYWKDLDEQDLMEFENSNKFPKNQGLEGKIS
jgi:hypothetical protein